MKRSSVIRRSVGRRLLVLILSFRLDLFRIAVFAFLSIQGHDMILERINEKIERRTEQLQDQLDVHQAAIMRINREIQELNKARGQSSPRGRPRI